MPNRRVACHLALNCKIAGVLINCVWRGRPGLKAGVIRWSLAFMNLFSVFSEGMPLERPQQFGSGAFNYGDTSHERQTYVEWQDWVLERMRSTGHSMQPGHAGEPKALALDTTGRGHDSRDCLVERSYFRVASGRSLCSRSDRSPCGHRERWATWKAPRGYSRMT